ncbi:MAG TPA: phage tail tape measure protein, partial [Comamonas sp.]
MASNKQLNATITIGGAVSSSLKSAFGTVNKSLQQVGSTISDLEKQNKLLANSIQTFGRQGKNVDSMRAKYAANTAAIDKLRTAQERLNRVEAARDRNMAKRDAYKSGILETVALGATVVAPVKAAMDFESTMADIRKVVDFPEPDGLQKMGQTILDMSRRLPMTANDIGKIVAAGGQSGIAAKELTTFAESAIKMGVAFDITADEAGQAMAEMRAAFRMTQPQVNALADKINYLGNNTAASAKDIMEIVQRIGPLGEVAGAASGSIAAMGATLRGMGIGNEIAATGIKNLLLNLSAGKAATKAQVAVFKQLGYTANEVSKSMQLNADETIRVILKKISQLPKHAQAAALTQLFGKEVVGSIAPLLTNLDQLQANLKLVGDQTKYAGSMEKEYQARAATTANSLIIFRNQVNALGITIGSVLLPAVNSLLMTVGPWVGQVTELAQKYPTVTKAVIATVGALVAMKVATFALGFAFTYLKGGLLNIVGLFYRTSAAAALVGTTTTTAAAGTTLLGRAFLFLGRGILWAGRMLLLNPIGLAVTAIA